MQTEVKVPGWDEDAPIWPWFSQGHVWWGRGGWGFEVLGGLGIWLRTLSEWLVGAGDFGKRFVEG